MKLKPITVTVLGTLFLLGYPLNILSPIVTASAPTEPQKELGVDSLKRNISVGDIARQVTVRILTNPRAAGSGVIVARKGQTYTVLTDEHIIAGVKDRRFTLITEDGIEHEAWHWKCRCFSDLDLDLALVQFKSNRDYQAITLAEPNTLTIGNPVYSAGFRNYTSERSPMSATFTWGNKAFQLTEGQVALLSDKSLRKGYRLGYTNLVEDGMSGGPVLNQEGELVGINGRLGYPLQGRGAFTFTDGTQPSAELSERMYRLSWAIPVDSFRSIICLLMGESGNNFP